MSYRPKLDPKSRKAARFISRLQRMIQKALIDSGKTQQQIALSLDVDRSVINRRLKGNANLTARSIAELAYAFDKEIELKFVDRKNVARSNQPSAKNKLVALPQVTQNMPSGTIKHQADFAFQSEAL